MSAAQETGIQAATSASGARIWSPQQQAIIAAVEDDSGGNLLIEALAGTGKTTTLLELMRHTYEGDSIVFCAFNSSIAKELASRVPFGTDARTLHSIGLRAINAACGQRKVDGDLWFKAMRQLGGNLSKDGRLSALKLVGLAKGNLLGWQTDDELESLDALVDDFELNHEPHERELLVRTAGKLMQTAYAAPMNAPVDFDDMIWLPVVKGWKFPKYKWVFVDETQDLNPCQQEIITELVSETGRIVAVGDRHQAIYAFRGAGENVMTDLESKLAAKVLPLSITYRCPKKVVAHAARLVPEFTAAPEAPEGIVRTTDLAELKRDAKEGDFVLSRVNAPLISLAFYWISKGRRASIRGRDIGTGLVNWVKATHSPDVASLRVNIDGWERKEVERLMKADRPTQGITDKAGCLRALCEGCTKVGEVIAKCERLFADRADGGILLSSTHRAKGLEANRVWLLRDTYRERAGGQEANLLYVAITRSKRELIYVEEDDGEAFDD